MQVGEVREALSPKPARVLVAARLGWGRSLGRPELRCLSATAVSLRGTHAGSRVDIRVSCRLMRVLVTGAAGFIGSAVVRTLLQSSNDFVTSVVAFDSLVRTGSWTAIGTDAEAPSLVRVQGDVRDVAAMRRACLGVDAVVHCAAESSVDASFERAPDFQSVNIDGTRAVAEAALAADVTTLIHFSTDEVYGEILTGAASETAQLRPTNPYAQSKAESELALAKVLTCSDVRLIILRPSNNYGPWQVADNLIPRFVTLLSSGLRAPLYGSGQQRRCWVHVHDTARAVKHLLQDSDAYGVYNIGGEELTNQTVVQHILDRLGLDWSWIDRVADRPVHDARYCNDDRRLRSGGFGRIINFAAEIPAVIDHYRSSLN